MFSCEHVDESDVALITHSRCEVLCVLQKAKREAEDVEEEEKKQEAEAKMLEKAKKREEAENPKCSVCTVGAEECSV